MNWLERTIASVAPTVAASRAEARLRIERADFGRKQTARAGSYLGKRNDDSSWYRNSGKVEDVLPRRAIQKRRIRSLLETNPFGAKAINALLNNLVGVGIFGTPEKGTPKKVKDAWLKWTKHSDWMNELDFFGQQDLVVRTMLGDGEAFIVRRFDAVSRDPGTRLQILDADMLATWEGQQGFEFDDDGRVTHFHFRKGRPDAINGANGLRLDSMKVAAENVIHLFRRDRAGQTRGRSIFEPVVERLESADEYLDAEGIRKKIEACFVGFISQDPETASPRSIGNDEGDTTRNDFPIETFEPGMIERLDDGEQITFGEPKATAGLKDFMHVIMQSSSAGAMITYELGTGDLSNVNYSSYRAGHLEFQRFCRRLQWLLIIPRFLDRVWEWFLDDGYKLGLWARNDYAMRWVPPRFESIDPQKSAKGDAAEIGAGLDSRRRKLTERGYDHDVLMTEIADDLETTTDLGLAFAGDPKAPDPAADKAAEPGATSADT